MKYVSKHNLQGVKDSLKFQSKYVDHAQEIKKNVSIEMKMPLEDITFIGVHNRRTVSYMYVREKSNKLFCYIYFFQRIILHISNKILIKNH